MEQKQRNFSISLKKGQIGEDIIRQYLEKKGWIVYCPFTKDKAHYFDMLATKDKQKVIAIDVKTKARFNNWPAQGINIKHYNEYMKFIKDTNVSFYLIFVDDKSGDVYAADLKKLENCFYPTQYIIAWNLSEMKFLFKIKESDLFELSKYDQRNYEYAPNDTQLSLPFL